MFDTGHFLQVYGKFSTCHKNPGNNNAHYFSTLLGLVGFLGLLSIITGSQRTSLVFVFGYVATLLYVQVPPHFVFHAAVVLVSALIFARSIRPSLLKFGIMIALGYGLQDLAHIYYKEPTYQSTSWGKDLSEFSFGSAASLFVEHVFYLLPLVLKSLSVINLTKLSIALPLLTLAYGCFCIDSDSFGFPHAFARVRALFGSMRDKELTDLDVIRRWALDQDPPRQKTSHWFLTFNPIIHQWVRDLGTQAQASWHRLVECDSVKRLFATKFDRRFYALQPIHAMNELYISGPNRKGSSDQVFFTEHIDGPFTLFPFASVYRCIVGMDDNTEISTIFESAYVSKTAKRGDILAFDFNREPHRIASDSTKQNTDFRIVMKLHYCVYPHSLSAFGYLLHFACGCYNILFRSLFLFTLTPDTALTEVVGTYGVNFGTVIYNSINKYLGWRNVLYVFAVGSLAIALDSPEVFIVFTQFVHYCRYINTYYIRRDADYGVFKRDALFYKSLTLIQLFGLAGVVLVLAGYFVSMCAAKALGVDGTYFGIELGHVKADYQFVTSFPYNILPHPMILSQIVALYGLHTFITSNAQDNSKIQGSSWLIPIHVGFYVIHMIQEQYDWWNGTPWFEKSRATPFSSEDIVSNFNCSKANPAPKVMKRALNESASTSSKILQVAKRKKMS